MVDLIDDVPEASEWAEHTMRALANPSVYGRLTTAVLWASVDDADRETSVDIDPDTFANEVSELGLPVFKGHDPGFPAGKALAARTFRHPSKRTFIAAVVGIYGNRAVSFEQFGVDTVPPATSPATLDALPDNCRLIVAVDPSEIDVAWLDKVLVSPPLPTERILLSHNSAEPQQELIRVGLVFAALVWNPFVTTVATEAGKKAYAAIHEWLRTLWTQLQERRNPVVLVQSHQRDCAVTFAFRGKELKRHYSAHEALPLAAAQAAKLIARMTDEGHPPESLFYEFERDALRWYPSHAVLRDGRLVSDRTVLVALEQVGAEMSLGIVRDSSFPPVRD